MKNTYVTIALVLVGFAAAGGLIWFVGAGHSLKPQAKDTAQQSTTQDATAVVATLHGGTDTITRGQLDTQIQELSQNPQIHIPDPSDKEARAKFDRLALDQLIGSILFFNEAVKQGFVTDDKAIDAELATITAKYQNVAAFEAARDAAKLTQETLRENVRHRLITNQYYAKIAAEHPVTVTDEEVKQFFDTQVAPQNQKAIFTDVKNDIKTHLEQQKMQEVIVGIIDELYKSADVQVLI